MKKLALITTTLIASATTLSAGELENLRSANAEHKRQVASTKPSPQYTVKKGDTLYWIAKTHKVTLQSLMSANSLNSSSTLRIGQKLSIPGISAPKQNIVRAKKTEASQLKSLPQLPAQKSVVSHAKYKIQRGDTFYGIARKHNVTVATLTKLNPSLEPSSLAVGQTVNLPSGSKVAKLSPPKINKTVQKTVAQKAPVKTPVSSTIVNKKKSTPVAAVAPPEPQVMQAVILSSPMTLQQLADKHKTTVDAVNALNNWSYRPSIKLAKGSEIYLPN